MVKRTHRLLRALVVMSPCFLALVGCAQVLGLDGLHDRADGAADVSASDTGQRTDAHVDATDARTQVREAAADATNDGRADAADARNVRGDAADNARDAREASADAAKDVGPPSCAVGGKGLTNCGVDGGESCCTSLDVDGGGFFRSYTSGDITADSDMATVSSFRLDKYLVTVGRFARFVSAGVSDAGTALYPAEAAGKHAYLASGAGLVAVGASGTDTGHESGWNTADNSHVSPTDANLGSCFEYSTWIQPLMQLVPYQENLPITCVNWYEAYAFCIWDGGFLPTQAEWEYAAVGGIAERTYPWGSTPAGTTSQYAIAACDYPSPSDGGVCGLDNIAPVGTATLGAGAWGQLDLLGELEVWLLDDSVTGGGDTYATTCDDCVYQDPSLPNRMVRGSSYMETVGLGTIQHLGSSAPDSRAADTGFRCARAP